MDLLEQDLARLSEHLRQHVGASSSSADIVTLGPVERLAATLGCELPAKLKGDPLPPGWHCLFCLPAHPLRELELDGLPRESYPVPAIPLARRVFGGAKLSFFEPIRISDEVACELRLANIEVKDSKAGTLVVATLERRYETQRGLALVETQDIVHLNSLLASGGSATQKKVPGPAPWNQTIVADPILLFRYSALTFNSHRIHYDSDYSRTKEKMPDLLVQGKLLSLLLLELLRSRNPGWEIARFEYRSTRPIYCGVPFTISGAMGEGGVQLWAADIDGAVAQRAMAYRS